ncbi:MAG: asparagine--tRNA ligase [Candidatus Rhabdochlamydia sp.]
MKRTKIYQITPRDLGTPITVCGWVKAARDQKLHAFIDLNDGSTLSGLQVVLSATLPQYEEIIPKLTTGTSICVKGVLVESPKGKQKWELLASSLEILGTCPAENYPLQKKHHSFEFLRTIAHLRARTNTQGAVQRVRSALAFATHSFFQEKGFLYVQTPIITASDCEGGGSQFTVSSLPFEKFKQIPQGGMDFSKDFFGQRTYLTVSGQLEGEALASALSDIYTFGPTFRAENSNTSRHLAEFWMIEPEMAFADLQDNMEIAEEYLKFIIEWVLKKVPKDLEFFDAFIEKGLLTRLESILSAPFARLSYTEAVHILQASKESFVFPVTWGCDLQSEHERYLAEVHCKRPVILTDYPAEIKSFYMKLNADEKTVAAMDIVVPKIGELIGGSQREDDWGKLKNKILQSGLNVHDYEWYLQLREFGSVPHAGFGAGFERVVQFITGMENIRDVIPFPRYPGHAEF